MKTKITHFAKLFTLGLFLVLYGLTVRAQVPQIGSQLFIPEDAQEAEALFRVMAEHNMTTARFWVTLDPFQTESWDFSKYDQAFKLAGKYGIGLCPTLGPAGSSVSILPKTSKEMAAAREYIKAVVTRFKDYPALDTWMLLNEPGIPPQIHPLAVERFQIWLQDKYGSTDKMWGNYNSFNDIVYDPSWSSYLRNHRPNPAFVDWYTFWQTHIAWYLDWIGDEIRKYDQTTPLHANAHALISNLASNSMDLPSWRPFLNSLGGSMHPSIHFGKYLDRDQYALGAAWECDLLKGAIEPKPFWITELQGGNNLNEGTIPTNPTGIELSQYLWINIGSGAKRVIFWALNPADNWSLLDFQGGSTDRTAAASRVAQTMNSHKDFFSNSEPVETQVTIILSLESMVVQLGSERQNIDDHIGRKRNAHLIAARAYYKTLQEMGIPVNIKHIHDYSWEEESGAPRLAIIPHATAITWEQSMAIEKFVKNGNTLLVSGLTGTYDEYGKFLPTDNFSNMSYFFYDDYTRVGKKFPWYDIFGGKLKEIRFIDEYYHVELTPSHISLPSHLWTGTIENITGQVLGGYNGYDIAIQNKYGKGKSIWIPSLIGIGAWEKDNLPLSEFLRFYLNDFLEDFPFTFSRKYDDCTLRTLKNKDRYLTVVTNGTAQPKECMLKVKDEKLEPRLIWGEDKQVTMKGRKITLGPRETVVLLWE